MSDNNKGLSNIGSGLAWLGFWLFLGMSCSENAELTQGIYEEQLTTGDNDD